MDDCSTDSTVAIAREFKATDSRVKLYVNEKSLGDYPNRNKAAEYATGKYKMVKFPMNLYWSRQHENQELKTGYAKKNYPVRSKELFMQALEDPLCPLTLDEVTDIKKKLNRKHRHDYLSQLAKKFLSS